MWKYKIITNKDSQRIALAYFETSTGIYQVVPFESRDNAILAKNYCAMKNAHLKEEKEFLLLTHSSFNHL